MSNLIYEEQVLVQDIFLIKTQVNTPSINNGNEIIFLKDFSRDVSTQGQGFSLTKNESMFDSMLMERANIPGTNTLEYFCQCYERAKIQKDKSWNIHNNLSQEFINYSMRISSSFGLLALTSPDLFEDQWVDPSWAAHKSSEGEMAAKVITFFEKVGFCYDFFVELDKNIQQEDFHDEFNEQLLTQIIDHQRKMNILDTKHCHYLSVVVNLLQFEHYKRKFISLKKYPYIPTPDNKGIRSDSELSGVRGIDLELRSALGPFLRVSTLDFLIETEQDKICINEMRKKVFSEFNNIRQLQQYNLQKKYYSELNANYVRNLVDLFKILLKETNKYPYAQDTLRFVAAAIIGNKDKAKLYRRLQQQKQQKQATSSDAFLMNLLDVMLEISKVIFDRSNNRWEKIKPQYFSQSSRLSHLKEEPLLKDAVVDLSSSMISEQSNEFGTITEYVLLCQQLAHFSLVPIFHDFKDNAEQLQRMEKELKRMSPSHQFYKIGEQKVNELKSLYYQYDVFLQIDARLSSVRNLYDLIFFLLPIWLKLDISKLKNNTISDYKPSKLLNELPENMITDVFDFHYFYVNFRRDYVKSSLTDDYINSFLNITILFLSNCQITSNPYLKAKLVEILYFFYQSEKSRVHGVLSANEFSKRNISSSLVKFYIDIEFTGDSMQFYSKFNYRHYVNFLFTKMWVEEDYQNEIKKIINEPLFERFINMLINDATYCTDEGISNMQKIHEMKEKGDPSTFSPQDYQLYERMLGTSAHFNKQSRETINLIGNISQWAPMSFLSDTFLDIITSMLNNFLKRMMDPTLNQYTSKENDFNSSPIIRDLIIIYGSLGDDKHFRQKVTSDLRSFDLKLFDTAMRRARKEQLTSGAALEKFQIFINSLNKMEIEEIQDFEEFPEEFQCSVSLGILSDPVMLPSSKCVVERSIIKKALLDNEIDPFNRSALKVSQLIEMPELKAKVDAWKKAQKSQPDDTITDDELEEALQGDVPDEFTCALSFCLLNDPVKLPSSGQNVERSMIKKALLDNEIDPFNRQKLVREQLIELPELKKKLDEWKAKKKAELKEKGTISSNKNKMEVEDDFGNTFKGQHRFNDLE